MAQRQEGIAKNLEGLRLEQSGDYEGAVQAFTEALTLNPGLASAHLNREEVLRRLGRETQVDLNRRRRAQGLIRDRPPKARRMEEWDDAQWQSLQRRLYEKPSSLTVAEVREVIDWIRSKEWTTGLSEAVSELHRRGEPLSPSDMGYLGPDEKGKGAIAAIGPAILAAWVVAVIVAMIFGSIITIVVAARG